MATRSANEQSLRHITATLGLACVLLVFNSAGCQYGPPQAIGSRPTGSANGSLFPFLGQTRVAPPATGSYSASVTQLGNEPDSGVTPVSPANQPASKTLPAPISSGFETPSNQKSNDEVWPESFGPRSSMSPPLGFDQGLPATDLTQVSASTSSPSALIQSSNLRDPQLQTIATQWESSQPVHANYIETFPDHAGNFAMSSSQSSPNVVPSGTATKAQQSSPQSPPQSIGDLEWRKPSSLPQR